MHKERVYSKLSPKKTSSISEEQMRAVLSNIFDKYDKDGDDSLDFKEFTLLINDIAFKKTGDKGRYTENEIKNMFYKLCRSSQFCITRDEFYLIYKQRL